MQTQSEQQRKEILKGIHRKLSNGIRYGKAQVPQAWLKERGLSMDVTGAGFCSGQIQHRQSKEYLRQLESVGFLKANNCISKNGDTGYLVFSKYGVIFPLRDVNGDVVNFYGIRIRLEKLEHSFMNGDGIYPAFPHEMTTRLIVTTNILDAATLMESRVMDNRETVMCIPDGKILVQHEKAIARLNHLKNIVWIESPKVELTEPLKGRVRSKLNKKENHE